MLSCKKPLIWATVFLMLFSIVGCAPAEAEVPAPTELEKTTHPLMEQYPTFFDLDTEAGLTVFAAKVSIDQIICSVYATTEADPDWDVIAVGPQADPATIKEILTWYNLSKEAITVTPYYSPSSSYIAPDLFEEQGMAELLYALGLGEKPADVQEEPEDSIFPYALCWADASEAGEHALRYTYYPITGSYAYKNELTYPAIGVKNAQELESFHSLANGYFSLSASMPGKESFNTLIKKYDEAFFENSGLVIVYITSSSTSISYKLSDAVTDGEELHITVAEAKPEGDLSQQTAGWFMVVEIPQQILAQVNYFSAA